LNRISVPHRDDHAFCRFRPQRRTTLPSLDVTLETPLSIDSRWSNRDLSKEKPVATCNGNGAYNTASHALRRRCIAEQPHPSAYRGGGSTIRAPESHHLCSLR